MRSLIINLSKTIGEITMTVATTTKMTFEPLRSSSHITTGLMLYIELENGEIIVSAPSMQLGVLLNIGLSMRSLER